MSQVLSLIDILAGAAYFVCAVLAFSAMGPRTKHCYRFVYLVIFLASIALMLGPVFTTEYEPFARAAMMLAGAFYMVLDRRRIRPHWTPTAPAVDEDPDRTQPGLPA